LGHHIDNGSNQFRWRFVPVPNEIGWYYISDSELNEGIVTFVNVADITDSLEDPHGKENTKWRTVGVPGKTHTFKFYDKMNNYGLVAFSNDGNVFHLNNDEYGNRAKRKLTAESTGGVTTADASDGIVAIATNHNFVIADALYGKGMWCGSSTLGHHRNDGSNQYRWKFEPVPNESGWFYIIDLESSSKGIVAPANIGGMLVSLEDPYGKENAKWNKVVPAFSADAYWLYDKMNNQGLVALMDDGNVAVADPQCRVNGKCRLIEQTSPGW
jgi:hypothetical protein